MPDSTGAAAARSPRSLAWRSGLAYFGWVFGAGFLLGTLRVTLLVPRWGERWAELLEMPVMLVVIWFASGRVVRRHALPRAAAVRLASGGIALALLIAAELLLAVALSGRSLGEYLASRDPVSGAVYLGMLGVYAAMPALRLLGGRAPDRR